MPPVGRGRRGVPGAMPRSSRSARLAAAVTLAMFVAAPLALAADPVGLGVRNTGAGAIYGCRSSLDLGALGDPARSTPCLRVNNLRGGKAFDFAFDSGPIGGVFQSGASLLTPNPRAAPFVTNATAVAIGLNADRLDGRHATDLIAEARSPPASTPPRSAACRARR